MTDAIKPGSDDDDDDDVTDVWHDGERAVQERMGVRARLAEVGPHAILDAMPDAHRAFFGLLPFAVLGVLDDDGHPRASLLCGPPGFLVSPDPRTLTILTRPSSSDPIAAGLKEGAPIGLLGLQPHTRRRNRANGVVDSVHDRRFAVQVRQSFGNCPKYIQAREPSYVSHVPGARSTVHRSAQLDDDARRLIGGADTFFIASAHPSHGVDVSHRGGKPGFVDVDDDGVLLVPDFLGNHYFNTLGNLVVEPRAGLCFVDYDSGALLQLSVTAEVLWEGSAVDAFVGAQRLLRFVVSDVVRLEHAVPLRWSPVTPSPLLRATGEWPR